MAIFHSATKIISRSKGRSAVAAAAYRAGEEIYNIKDGKTHNFTNKKGVMHKEIILPPQAQESFFNRSILWNEVEQAEKRKDAQTAREIELALPREFNLDEQIKLVREYSKTNFVNVGMCVDFAIHDKNRGNPHAHIMLTMRELTPKGFGKKARGWNDRKNVTKWRQEWAALCNRELKKKASPPAWMPGAIRIKASPKPQQFI